MKRLIGFMAGLVLLGLLAGCATLSKAECVAGDWRGLGVADGARGLPMEQIEKHSDACADHGIAVNRALYETGRQEGVLSYCRIDRAEIEGRAGRTNHHVCTGDIGVSFERVYKSARTIERTGQKITVVEGELDRLLDAVTAPGLTDAQRLALRFDISSTRQVLSSLNREMQLAERELRLVYADEQRRLR